MITHQINVMAILIVSIADEKAKTLKSGDMFEVKVPSLAIPPRAHYAEIIPNPLESLAQKSGYKLLIGKSRNDFTYFFTKL
jgi:hypothetical protein